MEINLYPETAVNKMRPTQRISGASFAETQVVAAGDYPSFSVFSDITINDIFTVFSRSTENVQATPAAMSQVVIRNFDEIERDYILENRERIFSFLNAHPYLFPILLEAVGEIHKFFPVKKLSLKFSRDPESSETYLVVRMHSDLDPDEAVDSLQEFDLAWGYNSLIRSNDNILFTLGF